ncbi:hypothetical protein M011DRAFT_445523 [Sporormia fimetaria CBS 119925]|uniref:DNA-directed RNA polymerase subunit n=1 Tax=Sporormia fimetaria CBS 119925 TaxID=1340428 RepID=A0A6A6V7A8_9PLEO|nr:hypothetical protein M011DRAFT_445523 [Sporormia fimetaria CBS 119925]
MSLVGTLLFCTTCGALLNRQPLAEKTIKCDYLNRSPPPLFILFTMTFAHTSSPNQWPSTQTTHSKPNAFPSSLQRKKSKIQIPMEGEMQTWALVSHTCPQCQHPEMRFRDLQMRSADEGTTIFYHCPSCGHRFTSDN